MHTEPIDLFPTLAHQADAPDPFALSLQTGLMVCGAVVAAVKLQVFDALSSEPQSIETLSLTTRTHAPSLYLLLRALAAIGITAEVDQDTHSFVHTERSRALQTDAEGGMMDLVRLWGADYQWEAWKHLHYTILTGKPALAASYGEHTTLWTYLQSHPHEARIFQRGLVATTNLILPALLAAMDVTGMTHLVDVGGGRGHVSRALLAHFPHLHVTLVERPEVIEQAREHLHDLAPDLLARSVLLAGDFFVQLPAGADCYLLKHVLMDWPDDAYVQILERCRVAMNPEGRVLVVEPVIGHTTPFTLFFSLQMAAMMRAARHRTLEEHQSLFAQAGFSLRQVRPLGLETMLLEGVPAAGPEGGPHA